MGFEYDDFTKNAMAAQAATAQKNLLAKQQADAQTAARAAADAQARQSLMDQQQAARNLAAQNAQLHASNGADLRSTDIGNVVAGGTASAAAAADAIAASVNRKKQVSGLSGQLGINV